MTSGQLVFHVEVFPLSSGTPSTGQTARNSTRQHEQPLKVKGVWEDNLRDLDELLQQFDDPVAPKKTNNKKTNEESRIVRRILRAESGYPPSYALAEHCEPVLAQANSQASWNHDARYSVGISLVLFRYPSSIP